jgi:hypothetical protein
MIYMSNQGNKKITCRHCKSCFKVMEIPIKTEFRKVFIQGENWKIVGFL